MTEKKNKNFLYLQKKTRIKKIKKTSKGKFNFPNTFKTNYTIQNIIKNFKNKQNDKLKNLNIKVKIAGRIIKKRVMGKATFIIIKNLEEKIQLYIGYNNLLNNEKYAEIKTWNLGDILGAYGVIFKTKTQELSINCIKIKLLTKSIKPIPNKFHGLKNTEKRYRQRYLDLITNKNLKKIFKNRSLILRYIRNFMHLHHFIEVETPMLQNIPGGASAKPFKTYHNKLNSNMFLRISPELYLKQLIIGGFEKIFEINRNFRNEGISTYHNPEFTMMELYIAYANYHDLMKLIQNLFKYISLKLFNHYYLEYKNYVFNLNKPFKKIPMINAILKFNPDIKLKQLNDTKEIIKLAKKKKIKYKEEYTKGKLILKIFEKTTEKKIIKPTFITKYPIETSPLARKNDKNKNFVDRFELFIGGLEIGNGFSELNDPIEQKKRFINQKTSKKEKKKYDKDYILAMEYGLPPTAGLGIGIDRLIMLFTNQNSIRDVILFPTLKKNND
ncbi:lysine--tRNA ligase [Buchnera aphidicola (Mollitrichosiphum nigrofasciatum)]|uniref:lysine--tRNA ligase n=1 Tax=Buchnera aphidicola TaxID=9 RepID=UPI0031B846CE